MDLRQKMAEGMAHHQAGRLGEAEGIYRQVLEVEPKQPQAVHYLGMVLAQRGDLVGASELLGRAATLLPLDALVRRHWGNVLRATRRTDEAIAAYRSAVGLAPNVSDVHYELANALMD